MAWKRGGVALSQRPAVRENQRVTKPEPKQQQHALVIHSLLISQSGCSLPAPLKTKCNNSLRVNNRCWDDNYIFSFQLGLPRGRKQLSGATLQPAISVREWWHLTFLHEGCFKAIRDLRSIQSELLERAKADCAFQQRTSASSIQIFSNKVMYFSLYVQLLSSYAETKCIESSVHVFMLKT